MENEQLRREAAMKRIPVSQAVEDIKVTSVGNSEVNPTKLGLGIHYS